MADLDFQPVDFQPEEQQVPQAAAPIDFKPVDFQPESTESNEIDKSRSFWDRPALTDQPITDAEIQQIADKRGVKPEDLRSALPFLGGTGERPQPSDAPKAVAGTVGSLLLNIPQKIYKKYEGGEFEKALDDVQELANKRKSYLGLGTELIAPVGGSGLAGIGGHLATGAAIGAAAGFGSSKKGEELTSTALGAGLGTAISGVTSGITKLLSSKGSEAAAPEIQYLKSNQAQIEDGTKRLLDTRQQSEQELANIVLSGDAVTKDAAKVIVKEQIPEDRLANLLSSTSTEGEIIAQRAEAAGTTPEQLLATDLADTRLKDLAGELSDSRPGDVQKAYGTIQDYADRMGGEQAVLDKYTNMVQRDAALQYITDNSVRVAPTTGKILKMGADSLSDAQFVLRSADEKLGTNLEQIHQQLNKDYNKFTVTKDSAQSTLESIYKQASKNGADDTITNSSKIYNALDTGDMSALTPGEAATADRFKRFFENIRQRANTMEGEGVTPLSIPKIENYVPHLLLQPSEAILAFERKTDAVLQEAEQRYGQKFVDLAQLSPSQFGEMMKGSQDMADLVKGVQLFDGKPVNSSRDLLNRVKELTNTSGGFPRVETQANSALERRGDIPMFLRETNLYKLADRWVNNTFRHIYLRNDLEKLRSMVPVLKQAGADVEAGYVNRLVGDIVGIRPISGGRAMTELGMGFQRVVDNMVDRVGGKGTYAGQIVNSMNAVPSVMRSMVHQIYPNLLGFAPRSLYIHMVQPMTKLMPELGGAYGIVTVSKAAVNVLANLEKHNSDVMKMGLLPAAFTAKGRDAIAEGIQRTAAYKLPAKTINALGHAGMYLFEKLARLNRAITLGTAEQMSYDLMRGSQAAYKSLQGFPTALQRSVAGAIKNEDGKAVTAILANHLNASTQYNYNRISMSEFGRVLGPMFSTFSKWPTATAGEILGEFRNRGLVGGSAKTIQKYVAPYALLTGLGYLIYGDRDNMSDRQKKLLGSEGLASGAPLGTMKSVLTGDFFGPPAIDALWSGTVVPMIKGNDAKAMNGAASAIQNFTPGAGLVRFLTDDLVTYATGTRPEGNFLERTQEGLQRITK